MEDRRINVSTFVKSEKPLSLRRDGLFCLFLSTMILTTRFLNFHFGVGLSIDRFSKSKFSFSSPLSCHFHVPESKVDHSRYKNLLPLHISTTTKLVVFRLALQEVLEISLFSGNDIVCRQRPKVFWGGIIFL